jgi:membrane protein YqaA with SNARE-associated domain
LVVSGILLLSVLIILKYNIGHAGFGQMIQQYGSSAVFVISFFLEIVPQFLHPFSSVFLAVGFGVEVWVATTLCVLGSFLGAVIGFELGRRFGFHVICPFFRPKTIRRTVEKLDQYGSWFLIVAAVLPLPYLPVVFGSLGIKRKTFWVYGIVVRACCFIVLGGLLYQGIRLF